MAESDNKPPNKDPWEGMTYEEMLANPPKSPGRKRPKAVLAAVSPRMHAAVQAKPEALRLVAEDEHGNTVIDRPYRPARRREEQPTVPDGPHSAVGAIKWGRGPWPTGVGNPVWDRPGRGDELVKHQYDIFAVLREDD